MYAGIWEIDLHGKNEYQARVTLDAALRRVRPGTYRIRVIHGHTAARPCGSWCAGNTADTRRCCGWRRQVPA